MPNVPAKLPVETAIGRLLEHPTRTLTGGELRGLGALGELLRKWGALEELEPLATIRCRACDEDHEADLEFDDHAGGYRYHCGSAGFVRAADDDVRVFRFDPEWLLSRLSAGLRIHRPRHRELIANVLWDLSDAGLGGPGSSGRRWSAFLARSVGRHLDPILEALRTRGGKLPGLVLTSSPDAPWSLTLPYGHRFMPLGDILEIRADVLEVVPDVLLAALRGGPPRQIKRDRGRPTSKDLVLRAFTDRQREGMTLPGVKAEAAAIRDILSGEHPELRHTAVRTVENIIRASHSAWRSAEARRTK